MTKIKPELPTEKWLKDEGAKARRGYKNIMRNSRRTRSAWIKLGEIAMAVDDASPRGSGVLGAWRLKFLPEITPPMLSDTIWCARYPKAVALVDDNQNFPQAIRKHWRQIAKGKCESFVEQGCNDVHTLAKELGVVASEIARIIERARDKVAGAQQEQTAPEPRVEFATYEGILPDAQTDAERIRLALDALRAMDVPKAVAILEGK